MRRSSLVCCSMCGSDTKNRSKICSRCFGQTEPSPLNRTERIDVTEILEAENVTRDEEVEMADAMLKRLEQDT